jgi:hemerythrin-like domain-containing protein
MNTATMSLENDHVNILRLIDVMEKMVHKKSKNLSHLELVVNLIRSYADGYHHAKEENLLFPLMVKRGFSTQQGPVAVMLNDHEEGRNFVREMSAGIELLKQGNELASEKIFKNIEGYCNLLKNHISKENNVLFKMANNVLTTEDQQELLKDFENVKKQSFCGGTINDCIAAIEKLELEYKN